MGIAIYQVDAFTEAIPRKPGYGLPEESSDVFSLKAPIP